MVASPRVDGPATIDLLSCVGQLVVAMLVFLDPRRRRDPNPVSLPLGLLALDVFAWNFFEFAYRASGEPTWHSLDLTFSPFSPVLVFLVAATVSGQRRRMRPLFVLGWSVYAALSVCAAAGLFWPHARAWADSATWSAIFVATEALLAAVSGFLLLRHAVRSPDRDERRRAAVVLGAVMIGMGLTTTDLWHDLGFPVPALGSLGTLIGMALIALASLRFELLGQVPRALHAWGAVTVALVAVAGYVVAFRRLRADRALLAITSLTVASLVVMGARALLTRWWRHRTRIESLADLGKLADQMAHDLQNPLAAAKGATQFIRGELARGRALGESAEFLELMEQQIDRMTRIIADYRRLGRAEPRWHRINLNELVRSVLSLHSFVPGGAEIRTELADGLPTSSGDPDLLSVALENLLRNAADATATNGGAIVVRTGVVKRIGFRRSLLLSVEDSGVGMNAQQLDRAFDLFFTTKATGSGLGLAYVRRVVVAHRGHVTLSGRVGAGTTVNIYLPPV